MKAPSSSRDVPSDPAAAGALAQRLHAAVERGESIHLGLYVAGIEVGRIDVAKGRVVHAELPGVAGEPALGLVERLPPVTVATAPYRGGPVTVTPAAAARFVARLAGRDAEGACAPTPSREQPPSSTPDPGASYEGQGDAPRAIEGSSGDEEDFDALWARAMDLYLRRDFEAALALFERCERLRPGDPRVAHNLERLRRRLEGRR